MIPDSAETERFLHEQIPLTKAMGVRVEVTVEEQGRVCMTFAGTFVAIR